MATKASAGNPRRVLIIVENLPCPFDRRVWQEAQALRDNGYRVSIICPIGEGYEDRYEILEDIHIYRHPLPFEADRLIGYIGEYGVALFWEAMLTIRVGFTRGFDILHACNPPDTIFLIGAVARLFGKIFIFDHHDVNPELFEAKFGGRGFGYWLTRLLEWLSFRVADVSIATNQSYRDIAIQRGGKSPEDVFIVRSGPDLGRLTPVEPVAALKNGRRYLVGYVGVMGKQEGIDSLLRSAHYLVDHLGRMDVQFVLVGGGTELGAMRDYARELGADTYVTFTGRVPDHELIQALSTADICVNPDPATAMNDKSTMNKIMEYMAFARPIVQFDLAEGRFSAQEASLYAKKGDEADFAEKIANLLDDPDRRQRMGKYGRERVEQHLAWRNQVPTLLDAYNRALSKRGKSRARRQDV